MIIDLKKSGQQNLYLDANALLTPSAKDAIRNHGINLIYGDKMAQQSVPANVACSATSEPCVQSAEKPVTAAKSNLDDKEIATLVDMIMDVLRERGLLEQLLK